MAADSGFDPSHDAATVRLYVDTWRYTALGDEVDPETRARVLAALTRIELAADAWRAGKEAA